MNRAAAVISSAALLAGTVVGVAAGPASAQVYCPGEYYFTFSAGSVVWEPTNIHSDWMAPGVKATYTTSGTDTLTGTVSASFTAEEGVLFASVKEQYGVSVAKSWAQTSSWSYTGGPTGKVGRLMRFHKAVSTTATEHLQNSNCTVTTIATSKTVVPSSSNSDNKWDIQYQ